MKPTKPYLKRKAPLPEAKPQVNPLKAILQYAAVPLSLTTALLYLFGYVYYETYLSFWGLSVSLFPLSKDHSVINGFFRTLLYSVTMLPKLALIAGLLLAVMIATIGSTYRPITVRFTNLFSRFKRTAVPTLRRNVAITPLHDSLMGAIGLIAAGIGMFIIILAVVGLSCAWVAGQAKKDACKEHTEIHSGEENNKLFSSRATLHVKNESKTFDTYSGHLIQSSSSHVALYDKHKGMIIFPLLSVSRIEIPENKVGAIK